MFWEKPCLNIGPLPEWEKLSNMSKRSKLLGSYSSFKPQKKLEVKIVIFIKIILAFFLIYQFVSIFIISSFIVQSSAMEPGITKGQHILSAPILTGASLKLFELKIPGFKETKRGDIVLVRPGNAEKLPWYINVLDPILRFFTLQKKTIDPNRKENWNNQLAVKRIIGIPGDTVKMLNYIYFIKPADETSYKSEEILIEDEYNLIIPQIPDNIDSSFPFAGFMVEIKLDENQYFVSNDNRGVYYDSRLYGSISGNNILGPVFFSYLPGFSFK
jgi:signal peptidase I